MEERAQPVFIPCDLTVLAGEEPPNSGKTTDVYLASLAAKHGLEWATLDDGVKHPASFLIPQLAYVYDSTWPKLLWHGVPTNRQQLCLVESCA